MSRKIRVTAWVVLVALAILQAYAHRYAVSPDGISYLDLSDAITTGHWSRLVNLYWSPLYPALIGIGRAIAGAGATTEIPVVHAVNVVCFIVMFAAFEYLLVSILSLAAATPRSVLRGPWGQAAAYALFGFFALTMNPMDLTTPDALSGAAAFAAFGAMLRMMSAAGPTRRDALVFGASLGAGALAKSFLVPWGLVCFAVMAIALRRRGLRQLAMAAVAWAVFVVPWSALLTATAGRPTFGDAGRLTYGWYVNDEDAPSAGGVPSGARTASTELILPGVGVTGDTVGTDPMWFDPVKWNRTLRPHFDLKRQLKMLRVFSRFYLGNLTPLLFLLLLIAVAPEGSRRVAWRRGWVVYLPAFAGMFAYAMVVVTARYIMPFELAGTLTLLATLPLSRRMRPLMVLVGAVAVVALETFDHETAASFSFVVSVLAGVVAGVLTSTRIRVMWVLAVLVALVASRLVFPARAPVLLGIAGLLVPLLLWRLAFRAVHTGRAHRFAQRTYGALAVTLGALLLLRFGLRLDQDMNALQRSADPARGNAPVLIASEFAAHGVGPGSRIALIGPHAESYWARTGRMHIVASVPRTRVTEFWALSRPAQDSLFAEFARAGATVVIASLTPPGGPPGDDRWIPLRYNGWMRRIR